MPSLQELEDWIEGSIPVQIVSSERGERGESGEP